jgi:hypothetical protein
MIISACNPRISTSLQSSYSPLDYKQKVIVIDSDKNTPANSEVLGQVKIGDTGFTTNCGYNLVIEKAKLEARKAGGNAIKIIKHRPPSIFGSTCHRITAKILRIKNPEQLITKEEKDLLDIDHAIFYVYRPSGSGFLVNYDLHLDDSVICRVKNNFKTIIRIYKEGRSHIWARTESKTEVPLNIKHGKEYYIRCGINMGFLLGRPSINLVDESVGEKEYQSVESEAVTKDLIVRTNGERIVCDILKEEKNRVVFNIKMDGNTIKTKLSKDKIKKIEYAE